MTIDDSGAREPGTAATDETDDGRNPAELESAPIASPPNSLGAMARSAARQIARQRHIGKLATVVALAALLGAGYTFGAPPSNASSPQQLSARYSNNKAAGLVDVPAPAATSGPAQPAPDTGKGSSESTVTDSNGNAITLQAATSGSVIIKTGQLDLQVQDIDKAISAAQSAVAAAGGNVAGSNRSGSDQYASATMTFRVPAAKWDDTLAALRKIGSKVLSEQTGTNDVTMQVVDLNARLDNLQKAESALQAIMARATTVADVLAVQTQLTQTQGQIEQLTAQRDHLNDQAAMSTLTVNLSLPGPTVTTQATQDWTLGNQIDQAGAALVRVGQGIVTMGVWAIILVAAGGRRPADPSRAVLAGPAHWPPRPPHRGAGGVVTASAKEEGRGITASAFELRSSRWCGSVPGGSPARRHGGPSLDSRSFAP